VGCRDARLQCRAQPGDHRRLREALCAQRLDHRLPRLAQGGEEYARSDARSRALAPE